MSKILEEASGKDHKSVKDITKNSENNSLDNEPVPECSMDTSDLNDFSKFSTTSNGLDTVPHSGCSSFQTNDILK